MFLPNTDPNIHRPTPDHVLGRIRRVQEIQDAIARAKAASFCPGNAAYTGNNWVASGGAAGTGTGQGTTNSADPNYQGGGGSDGGLYDSRGGSTDYYQDIADAPVVQGQKNEPCPEEKQVQCLAPATPQPNWGNGWSSMPQQTCAVGVLDQTAEAAKGMPWWLLLLIGVGGVLAVREVLD